jgi:hypothetical protein
MRSIGAPYNMEVKQRKPLMRAGNCPHYKTRIHTSYSTLLPAHEQQPTHSRTEQRGIINELMKYHSVMAVSEYRCQTLTAEWNTKHYYMNCKNINLTITEFLDLFLSSGKNSKDIYSVGSSELPGPVAEINCIQWTRLSRCLSAIPSKDRNRSTLPSGMHFRRMYCLHLQVKRAIWTRNQQEGSEQTPNIKTVL